MIIKRLLIPRIIQIFQPPDFELRFLDEDLGDNWIPGRCSIEGNLYSGMNKSGIIERVKIRKCLERFHSILSWKSFSCERSRLETGTLSRAKGGRWENGLNRCLLDKFLATIVNFASRISTKIDGEECKRRGWILRGMLKYELHSVG